MRNIIAFMTWELLIALALFGFVASITPGPNNLMLMASGANYGVVRTIPHMLGVGLGFAFLLAMTGLGLVKVFDLYPPSLTLLKVVSVLYLLYLAWKIARAGGPAAAQEDADGGEVSGRPLTFLQAAMFQWVNPKGWTMAVTAITVYAPKDSGFAGVALIVLVFAAVNIPSVTSWAILGEQMSRLLSTPLRVRMFNISAAALLIASLYPTVVM